MKRQTNYSQNAAGRPRLSGHGKRLFETVGRRDSDHRAPGSATYAGPHLSFSALVMKVSLGWMVDVNDRSDHHIQLAIGAGF